MTIEIIAKNTFGHFKYLPDLAGFCVKQYDDITIINAGLNSSMFNVVCDTHLEKWAENQEGAYDPFQRVRDNISILGDVYLGGMPRHGEGFIEKKIHQMITLFNNQPFAWWLAPTCDPAWLPETLKAMYFKKSTTEHAMLCELKNIAPAGAGTLSIQQVLEKNQLDHFIEVIEPYDAAAREFYEKVESWMLDKQEKLFVGYEHNTPAVITTLYMDAYTKSAGIFNLITTKNKRGQGYGTQMMQHLLVFSQKSDMNYATLCASSDAGFRIYQQLSFETLGEFQCFEWGGK